MPLLENRKISSTQLPSSLQLSVNCHGRIYKSYLDGYRPYMGRMKDSLSKKSQGKQPQTS